MFTAVYEGLNCRVQQVYQSISLLTWRIPKCVGRRHLTGGEDGGGGVRLFLLCVLFLLLQATSTTTALRNAGRYVVDIVTNKTTHVFFRISREGDKSFSFCLAL